MDAKTSLVLLALTLTLLGAAEARTSPRSLVHPHKTGVWKFPHGMHRKYKTYHPSAKFPLHEVQRFPKLDQLDNRLEGRMVKSTEGPPPAVDWMNRYSYSTNHKVRHGGGRELHEEVVLQLQQDLSTPDPGLDEIPAQRLGVQNEDANHVPNGPATLQYSSGDTTQVLQFPYKAANILEVPQSRYEAANALDVTETLHKEPVTSEVPPPNSAKTAVVPQTSRRGANTSLSGESMAQQKKEFHSHWQRVYGSLKCKHPTPKVLHVQPEPGQVLVPHCTVLHRCGEDTGCCSSHDLVCTAKNISTVELYFQVASVIDKASLRFVKKVMENHTECECRRRSALNEQVVAHEGAEDRTPVTSRRKRTQCECPQEFAVRHLADGRCACDCFDKDRRCLDLKKGKSYFTYKDQLCIRRETCQLPACEYGEYLSKSSRCRRKNEGPDLKHNYGWKQRLT